jgi:hypothetical protein
MKEIITDAKKRTLHSNGPLVVVMDGALCLWTLLISLLKGVNWVGILDIIHVSEYLWKVGNALYGENTVEGKNWVHDHLLAILQGRVGRTTGGLKQILNKRKLKQSQRKALQDAISYFENHRQWMRYDEYLAAGYPVGSGVVESTCGAHGQESNGRNRPEVVNRGSRVCPALAVSVYKQRLGCLLGSS